MANILSSAHRRTAAGRCVSNSLHILPTVDHRPQKLIVANGGASYQVPENTLIAYRLALELGADFIKSDIVATSDQQLIAMCSVDLMETTNVKEIFPDREPWFSPHAKRAGYWSFNFTYDEISLLKVKQRLPAARTTHYDYLFKVPSLLEVVKEVTKWNEEDLPKIMSQTTNFDAGPLKQKDQNILRKPSQLELAQSGLFLELQDYVWLRNEAKIDLVGLMFQHFSKFSVEWDWIMPCFQALNYDTYKVPGLVIQSLSIDMLKRFHETWLEKEDLTTLPEPLYVVTTSVFRCNELHFWEEVDQKLHGFVSGVMSDKRCLIPENDTSVPEESMTITKARDMNLAIFPFTERPEKSSLAYSKFNSMEEETNYLLYKVGVGGIFTEAVSSTAAAVKMGAPAVYSSEEADSLQCYDIDREVGIYLGIVLFIMGCFVGGLFCIMGKRSRIQEYDPETEPMLVKGPPTDDDDVYVSPEMETMPISSHDETQPSIPGQQNELADEENVLHPEKSLPFAEAENNDIPTMSHNQSHPFELETMNQENAVVEGQQLADDEDDYAWPAMAATADIPSHNEAQPLIPGKQNAPADDGQHVVFDMQVDLPHVEPEESCNLPITSHSQSQPFKLETMNQQNDEMNVPSLDSELKAANISST